MNTEPEQPTDRDEGSQYIDLERSRLVPLTARDWWSLIGRPLAIAVAVTALCGGVTAAIVWAMDQPETEQMP